VSAQVFREVAEIGEMLSRVRRLSAIGTLPPPEPLTTIGVSPRAVATSRPVSWVRRYCVAITASMRASSSASTRASARAAPASLSGGLSGGSLAFSACRTRMTVPGPPAALAAPQQQATTRQTADQILVIDVLHLAARRRIQESGVRSQQPSALSEIRDGPGLSAWPLTPNSRIPQRP